MSITPIKVRIVKRPIIKARFVPQLPANLTGRTAIAVERNGSIYYLDLDYSKLAESLSFDPAQNVVAILRSDGVWHKTTVATLSTMIGADKPNLVAIANAATSADKLGYWSGEAQYSLTDFTAYMRTLLDDPDATTARATLGLVIGTDVQPHDAELDALAGLVSAADRLPYFTGPGAAALAVLTPFARTLLDDADAAAMRATIDAQQRDSDLDAIAALTPTDDDFIQRKAGAWVNRSVAQVKTDLAITNVDNTSDLNKPISTATQAALDLKADKAITVSAGTGLTGGGDLSANRSVALNAASIASLGKADTAVQPARAVNTGTGLTGGGDLSADRTIALDAASQASLAKADTAVQPGALGALAAKSKIDVPGDINATGTPSGSTVLFGDGTWKAAGTGSGDMLASVYDPAGIGSNAFEGMPVADRTALKALDTTKFGIVYLKEAGRQGHFEWLAGDYSAHVAADTQEGIYVKANAVAATAGAWVRVHDNDGYDIEWFGGKRSDTAFDNKPALDCANAIALIEKINVIRFGSGVYTFLSKPNPMTVGITLVGCGQSSSVQHGGTVFDRRFNQGGSEGFLRWDGTGIASNSTGGGARDIQVLAASGTTGGVGIDLYATSDGNRPGYMALTNTSVYGTGTGTWSISCRQDGSAVTTPGSQGLRDVCYTNCYFAGATGDTLQIINGTNNKYNGVYVYQASGTSSILRITGLTSAATDKSTNGYGTVFVSGTLVLDNCSGQYLFGFASDIQITSNATNCTFVGGASTSNNASTSARLLLTDKEVPPSGHSGSNFTRLPGNKMLAWGSASLNNTTTAVAFGATFGAPPSVTLTPVNASMVTAALTSVSATGFNGFGSQGGGSIQCHWQAIGNAP